MKKRIIIIGAIVAVVITAVTTIFLLLHKNPEGAKGLDYSKIEDLGAAGDDGQSYWSGHGSNSLSAAEDGYYFITPNGAYLMYFDIATKEAIPVCNKPDCAHVDKSCGCCLNDESYVTGNIYYYENKLYYMPIENGMAYLAQMDATGGNIKKIASIMPSSGNNGIHLVFHDGYVYAYDFVSHITSNKEHTEKITQICIATGEIKVIYETTGVNLAIQNVKSFGNKLFFTIQQNIYHEEKDDYERISKGLYVYDYESNEVTVLSEEDVHDYYVIPEDNLLYYYVTGEGLYRSNLMEHRTELIIKATKEVDMCNISYDGTYLYLSNIKWLGLVSGVVESATKKCVVADKKGNTINEISCDDFLGIYFGDDRYMFARNMNNELVYIDKREISTVTQWTSVLKEEMFLPTVRPQ